MEVAVVVKVVYDESWSGVCEKYASVESSRP